MSHPVRKTLSWGTALVAVIALAACGGSSDPAAPPLAQTISFSAPVNQSVGAAPLALVATATSGLTVSFASATPAVCTVSGKAATLLAAGSCSITASQAGSAGFAAATPVTNSFTVGAGAQSITFVSPGNQTLGTTPAALVASSTSALAVSFASSTPGVCTVSGNTLTLVAAGTCTLVASQAGNANYLAAASVTQSFNVAVGLLAQTISFTSPGNQTLGTAPAPLAASASSNLAVSFASLSAATCTVSGSTLTLVGAGTCTVAASQAGNNVYAAATSVMNSFTVVRAAQAITFNAPGNQTLGTAPPGLVASSSAGLPVALTSTTAGVCTVSGSTLTLVAVGTCSLDANQAGDATYAPATAVTRSFSVAAAAQTITFASPGNQTLGTTPPALVASASSGLAVSFSSTTPGICTVNGSALTLVAVGSCAISASQAGSSAYLPATTVSRVFQVGAAPLTAQTITFTSPGNQTVGTAPPALVATASSGLSVSFASTTPGVCTVSGNTLTLVAAGTCTLNANQAGNATYSAALQVSNSFTVAAAPLTAQTISFTSPGTQALGSTAPSLVASASSGLAVSFASGTPGICTVSGSTLTLVAAGSCTINANQAGNGSFAAAQQVAVTFTVGVNLIANGGFESAPQIYVAGTQPGPGVSVGAGYWLTNGANAVTVSSDAHTGSFSASLTCSALCASNLYGNSSDNGGLTLDPAKIGTSPVLTFWIKGSPGTTGNINYSLRYLNSTGAILGQSAIVTNTNTYASWTQLSISAGAIPVGTTAVFFEANYALGPVGVQPSGLVFTSGGYLIDDIQLVP